MGFLPHRHSGSIAYLAFLRCISWPTSHPFSYQQAAYCTGIIPEPKKSAIYKAMLDLAGPDGVVITVYWNGNEFGSALQHFYATNPQLCGEFEGQHINIRDCTLQTPSGYSTKWTKPEEARRIISGFNADVLEVREQGRGVLTAFRRKQDA
eukprot:TRINITY_DN6679_c0_g1_i1.p2 TRINITY_DN6679_c0_g1~~TRINITY_DN6679_c0_g1_i1.p2  ORF type:complete len:151 (+),score=19.99 TRINITY_DN6679_c0_g1_i1:1620-2072(+)